MVLFRATEVKELPKSTSEESVMLADFLFHLDARHRKPWWATQAGRAGGTRSLDSLASTVRADVILVLCHLRRDTDTNLVEPLVAATIALHPVNLREAKGNVKLETRVLGAYLNI